MEKRLPIPSPAWFLVLIVGLFTTACQSDLSPPDTETALRTLLDETVRTQGFEHGVALHVDSPLLDLSWQGAAGVADPAGGEPMTPGHPVRIASNTKTYVAAAVLRLWEDGHLGLDDSIAEHLPEAFVGALRDGGYQPEAMSVRHLLTHTSGLDDHGNERYAEQIVANPHQRWSRADQLQICVDEGTVQGKPGAVYRYSDTGYILLGEMLEGITGGSLAEAVWALIDRDGIGLGASWFETLEPKPEGVRERAHQFYGDVDVSAFDPSFDLWGGGGIATTVGDLARFTRALFTGGVFHDPETLETMLSTLEDLEPAADASERSLPPGAYRMGVWVLEREGHSLYRHTGFWCTSATYVPELDLVITVTANQHEAGEVLDAIVEGALDLVMERAAQSLLE